MKKIIVIAIVMILSIGSVFAFSDRHEACATVGVSATGSKVGLDCVVRYTFENSPIVFITDLYESMGFLTDYSDGLYFDYMLGPAFSKNFENGFKFFCSMGIETLIGETSLVGAAFDIACSYSMKDSFNAILKVRFSALSSHYLDARPSFGISYIF